MYAELISDSTLTWDLEDLISFLNHGATHSQCTSGEVKKFPRLDDFNSREPKRRREFGVSD